MRFAHLAGVLGVMLGAGCSEEPEYLSRSLRLDAGSSDGGPTDFGPSDGPDLGIVDATPWDAGPPDATPWDAGPPDAEPLDAEPRDAERPDADPRDAGIGDADSGLLDGGTPVLECGRGMATNLVVDPSFEGTLGLGLPDRTGVWVGDAAALLYTEGGVIALAGGRMAAFRSTGLGGSGPTEAAQLHQLVDVRSWAGQVGAGATLLACASFNRVQGDASSDSQFTVFVRGFYGAVSSFESQNATGNFAFGPVRADVVTDADPATWERACLEVPIGTGVDFFQLEVRARENVVNNTGSTEFDGHYVDEACLALSF